MIKTKLKECFGCKKPRHIWKQHEGKRYCKDCWAVADKEEPKSTPVRARAFLSKFSDKQQKINAAYSVLRKQFLKDHPHCEARIHPSCSGQSTQVHHKKGRGIYMLDSSKWLAVDFVCHEWIENNREKAIELGFSELRLTNKEEENDTISTDGPELDPQKTSKEVSNLNAGQGVE